VLKTKIWRVLLCLSAQLHDTADHAAMDGSFFDRENASKQALLSPDELPRSNAEKDRARRNTNASGTQRSMPV